jgi:hypothetical protein
MGYSRGLLTEDIYVRGESVAVTTARAQTVQNEEQNEVAATTAPGNAPDPTSIGVTALTGAGTAIGRTVGEVAASLISPTLANVGASVGSRAGSALGQEFARINPEGVQRINAAASTARGAVATALNPVATAAALRDAVRAVTTNEAGAEGGPATNEAGAPAGPATNTTAPQQSTSGNSPAQQANRQRVEHNLDPNVELSPRENIYQDAFDRYDIAMQLASRPACTLEQYIRFWHGGAEVGALVDQQIVTGPQDAFAYIEVKQNEVIKSVVGVNGSAEYLRGMVSHKVALYYDRIFKLRPGPGTGADRLTGPTEAERGYTDPPSVRPSTQHSGVAADYPQTRADWDSILITYRNKVRTLLRPTV